MFNNTHQNIPHKTTMNCRQKIDTTHNKQKHTKNNETLNKTQHPKQKRRV